MSQRLALAVDGAGLLPVYLKLNPHFVFHLDRTAANGHRGDFKLSLPQPRRTAIDSVSASHYHLYRTCLSVKGKQSLHTPLSIPCEIDGGGMEGDFWKLLRVEHLWAQHGVLHLRAFAVGPIGVENL